MRTYQEIAEKKLNKLNQQHVGTVKGLEKAMHSQGIDSGNAKRDGHHVQYPDARFRKSGKPAHGITAVDDGKGRLTSSTGGVTVRDAVLKSGRVNKSPKAKEERKKEAAENKARKQKNRDPFTREEVEGVTFSQFMGEATEGDLKAMGANTKQIDALKRRQAKRGYGFQSNDERNQTAPAKTQSDAKSMKALPPAKTSTPKTPTQVAISTQRKKGGNLAVRPADKGSSIVRHKNQINKDREASKSQAKQKLASGSAGEPKTRTRLGNASGEQGPKMTPQQNLNRARQDKREADKAAKMKAKKKQERNKAIRSGALNLAKGAVGAAKAAGRESRTNVGDSRGAQQQGSQEIIRGKRG